jgi:Protein of unknown function (DUF664)
MVEVTTDEYGRPEPPSEAGEVATLLGFLDYQRATLEWKCRGLSDEQLRVTLPPSSMTLGGLLNARRLAAAAPGVAPVGPRAPGRGVRATQRARRPDP